MKNARRKWIAERLQQLRIAAGLSIAEMAEKINVHKKTYRSHEEGRSEPDIFRLRNICEVLNVTVDKFLEGSPHSIPEHTC